MRGRRLPAAVVAASLTAMAAVSGLAAPALAKPRPPGSGSGCEVHALALPDGAIGGNVMDLERVRGRGVVYYGTYSDLDADGVERQRSVVWYGVEGEPVPVGPGGTAEDIAYELTSTGLLNGESLDPATGTWRTWVQNLKNGKVTYVDPAPDGGEPLSVFARRINDKGALAGSGLYADGTVRVLVWSRYHKDPQVLTGPEWVYAEALGINNRGDAVGAVWAPADGEEFFVPSPRLWSREGSTTEMATLSLGSAYPRLIDDAGHAAGNVDVGDEWAIAHREAAFWPTPDRVIGLGLLPGGGLSDAFGLDDGWVVGSADVFVGEGAPGADEWGSRWHSFLWTGEDPGAVGVLPSPYALEAGWTDWSQWYGNAAHAVDRDLNQVGTNAHGGYLDDGTPTFVPTVYLNADTCTQTVPTTHTPFWLAEPSGDAATASSPSGLRTASVPDVPGRPAGYGQRSPAEPRTR